MRRVCEEVLGPGGEGRTVAAAAGGWGEDFVFELLWRDFFRFSRMKMCSQGGRPPKA